MLSKSQRLRRQCPLFVEHVLPRYYDTASEWVPMAYNVPARGMAKAITITELRGRHMFTAADTCVITQSNVWCALSTLMLYVRK